MTPIEHSHTTARMSKRVGYGELVFLSGQTSGGSDAADASAQTAECLRRVDALLDEAGSSRSRILQALIHLKTMDDFAAMNVVWDAWVPAGAAPARTTVEGRLAAPNLLVEITVVAARG